MTLNSSGPLSLGGTTAGQSIDLELGVSSSSANSMISTANDGLIGNSNRPRVLPRDWYGVSAYKPPVGIYYLVVGGGGSGGNGSQYAGGGGGGGQVVYSSVTLDAGSSLTITVGTGGPNGPYYVQPGRDSQITGSISVTAVGGGAGGVNKFGSQPSATYNGSPGSSGGGGGSGMGEPNSPAQPWTNYTGGAGGVGTAGNPGGSGVGNTIPYPVPSPAVFPFSTAAGGAGGGGGAGGRGGDGQYQKYPTKPGGNVNILPGAGGDGGAGLLWPITGSYYGGGGGGGIHPQSFPGNTANSSGNGGSGGGGGAGHLAGAPGTGGGGAGNSFGTQHPDGTNSGGPGIVIIAVPPSQTGSATGAYSIGSASGLTLYRFTGPGTYRV